jgi:hypothetical protein
MSHIFLLYALPDHNFAHQLAVQIEQRGLRVWPVPNTPPTPDEQAQDRATALEGASHVLGILPTDADDLAQLLPHCQRALELEKHVIAIQHSPVEIPDHLKQCRVVDFEGQFLMAFEELSQILKKTHAPTRPLTVEHPPPVTKPGLLPIKFPAERCWREDRLRINYSLPIILTEEELQARLPAYLVKAHFDLTQSTKKRLRGQRQNEHFPIFDPRRTLHTLTIRRKKGRAQVYYRMTRMQVYYWFPAHYRVLDREAASLYRYLATGKLDASLFEPVNRQARLARALSWSVILIFWLVVALIGYLIVVV